MPPYSVFQSEGIAALEEVIASVPDDIPVILDVKRGDIGSTAAAYASAAFKVRYITSRSNDGGEAGLEAFVSFVTAAVTVSHSIPCHRAPREVLTPRQGAVIVSMRVRCVLRSAAYPHLQADMIPLAFELA